MNAQKCQPACTAESNQLEVRKPARIYLIRKFQRLEGNFECFASAYTRVCNQFECLWRGECLFLTRDESLAMDDHE